MKTRTCYGKQMVLFLGLWIGLVWGCAGCSSLLSSLNPTPTLLAPGSLLFQDDFSQVTGGWGLWNRQGAVISQEAGGLRLLIHDTQSDFWSVAGKEFKDVQIEASAARLGGPMDNDFGLICRYQDAENFYMLLISSDGYYGIVKMKGDKHSLIGADQLQYSQLIRSDRAVYGLRADCVGENLRLYLDGKLLMEAQDSDFAQGDVGVMAGAYSTPGVDIVFDNFIVKQPE